MRAHTIVAVVVTTFLFAAAEPVRGQDGAVRFFGISDPPAKHPRAVVAQQAEQQVRLYAGILGLKKPNEHQAAYALRLRDSLFSIARFAINESPKARDWPELARALMPLTGEELNRAWAKRQGYPIESSPLGERPFLYDVTRAIRICLTRPDGTRDRALSLELLRGLVGAVPFESGRESRQFLTQFEVHSLFLELFPTLPSSKGHSFKDWKNLTEVNGEVGKWIDGLAGALTEKGRLDNTARLRGRIDSLVAAAPAGAPSSGLAGGLVTGAP